MHHARLLLMALLLSMICAFVVHGKGTEIKIDATITGGAKPVIHGTTNLPEGTELTATIQSAKGNQYFCYETDDVEVQNGSFTTRPFPKNNKDLLNGKYTVEISLGFDLSDDDDGDDNDVQKKLKGMRPLKGKHVNKAGNQIKFIKNFEVNNSTATQKDYAFYDEHALKREFKSLYTELLGFKDTQRFRDYVQVSML
ncbi:MAG: hypothetical protein FWD79_05585 [Desulfobulbus sp.]|nr:hypothetical protein [Desulfobulbus sp.]